MKFMEAVELLDDNKAKKVICDSLEEHGLYVIQVTNPMHEKYLSIRRLHNQKIIKAPLTYDEYFSNSWRVLE